ncbi:hypothetical protein chiPu_0011183 [Chiloscyllium punctatum]|uniref:EMI domain-containing protein n=1 Tax=Chiloscyllium punctatum TaxID=137246 RepID=A0A401SQN5_CHIPU|nr:hypothetical protein [Chiloscyllium punctatum]
MRTAPGCGVTASCALKMAARLRLLLLAAAATAGGLGPQEETGPDSDQGGDPAFQWEQWQPWVCMCDIGKQGRVRYFVVSSETAKRNVDLEEFWQVKPCALVDCEFCQTTECSIPEVGETMASSRFSHRPPRPAAGSLRIPAAKPEQANSYDSLPVIDDVG